MKKMAKSLLKKLSSTIFLLSIAYSSNFYKFYSFVETLKSEKTLEEVGKKKIVEKIVVAYFSTCSTIPNFNFFYPYLQKDSFYTPYVYLYNSTAFCLISKGFNGHLESKLLSCKGDDICFCYTLDAIKASLLLEKVKWKII